MKKTLYWLGSLGLALVLVLGATVGDTRADRDARAESKKSPLRGTWSFSQFVPTTKGFDPNDPIPTASAGTFIMDDNNHFTGHAVLDTPHPPSYLPNPHL